MNVFKRFWKSLYSPQEIALFRNDKISKSIVYIFILAFMAFLPIAFHTTITGQDLLQASKEIVQKDLPNFKVIDGKLKTIDPNKGKLPLVLERNMLHIYFDASGALRTDSIDNKLTKSESGVAFLSDKIYFAAGGISQSISYKMIGIQNKADLVKVYQSIEKMSKYFFVILMLIAFIFIAISLFFQVALYGLFGFILTGLGKNGIHYKQHWIIASYSVTLATTFTMIMEWFRITVPFNTEINMVVNLIFIFLAVRAIPKKPLNY